jgi:type IV pilus assembly protein PilY1
MNPATSRTCRSALAVAPTLALLPCAVALAQPYLISNVPMVVPSALEPNITLSLDDSPGMANAFPLGDAFGPLAAVNGVATSGGTAPANTRRFKSSTFNPLYYNPNIRYLVPANAHATATTFTGALINGYYENGSSWQVNLSNGYRPTLSYNASGTSQQFAEHACADLPTLSNTWTCIAGTPSPANAVTTGTAAYYATFNTSTCNLASSADVNNDGCYSLIVIRSSTATYTIPAIGTPNNGRPDCATVSGITTCTFAQESQNFANWYSYYRTRHLAMVSAAWRVMSDPTLIGTRVAWQALNACNSFAANNTCPTETISSASNPPSRSNLIDEYSATRRDHLQGWLRALRPAAANASPAAPLRTALRRAGEYYSSSASINNPYLLFPQSSATPNPEYACRPNFHLLIAGGSYDDADNGGYCSGAACGNTDGSARTLPPPDNASYSAPRPYTDGNSNSLADAAFHYWATDLRAGTGMPNVLLPYYRDRSGGNAGAQYWNPKNDPARWQHMVNFTVGVGTGASLNDPSIPWTGNAFGGAGFANLLSGAAAWPATTAGTSGRMYDLWHAALTSRGEFFSAETPEQIVNAMTAALSRTIDQSDVGASLAANSTRLTTESMLYQASFSTGCFSQACGNTTDWTGRLRAIRVNTDGSLGAQLWDATDAGRIPAAASRRIFTSSANTTPIDFTWAALGSAGLQSRLGDENTLNYLRGDQSNELANGGPFRDRSVRLGDIVNSEIAFAGKEDFGYDALIDAANLASAASVAGLAYPAYLQSKSSRTKLVVVGANDGMLHGFDADTGDEKFAFVPRALLLDPVSSSDPRSNLVRLAEAGYTHRFYVDGSPWIGDYWNSGTSTWRTAVVGTTGAGGKGVFALDITAPDSMSAANVLWDLDGQSDPNLGFTIGQAVIGRLSDGHFYAFFGNGYRSANECPVLYIVRLHDGQVRSIPTGGRSLTAVCTDSNGLGRPSLYDMHAAGAQGYRTTDFVYAGDLQGNLWRFDLRNVNLANNPATGAAVQRMFTARNASSQVQPITGTIEIGAPPSGVTGDPMPAMLWFGTGRWFAVDDRTDTTAQTMYGFVDRFATGGNANTAKVARSNLVAQTINLSGSDAGRVTGNAVTYTGNSSNDGWYLDLPRGGERMVGLPLIQSGRLIFSTLIPNDDRCVGGGTSSILAVDPYNGTGLSQRIFLSDPAVDFIGSTVGIVRNLVYIGTGSRAYLYAGGTTAAGQGGSTIQYEEIRPTAQTGTRGRASWREILK